MEASPTLLNLTPRQQLRAGRMPRRLIQLAVGLWIFGASIALVLRSGLGLSPWDVLHVGIARHVPLSIGTVSILVGTVVLLLWIPLRQWPGLGTALNIVVVGIAIDATLALLPPVGTDGPPGWALRGGLLAAGVVLNGLAGAMYIGSQLGPGPRDGLMTSLSERTGWQIGPVRIAIEVTVLAIGWMLGGPVGLGTVAYALAIGPLVQVMLPRCLVRLDVPRARSVVANPSTAGAGRERMDR
ncbi:MULTISPECIES: membrane protein YczE [unclassified Luteococcus]|uniref:membrane protein YczE n=1 Tax=unclassified Luteococcus TaxID=2639923 RepID=UPI00313B99FF